MSEERIILRVVAALIVRDGRVLLCQRNEDDVFGLQWEFPGGEVEDGETDQQALAREIREELDVRVRVDELVGQFDDTIGNKTVQVFLYRCHTVAGRFTPVECRGFTFSSPRDAFDLDLAPVDRKIAAFLREGRYADI